MLTWTLIGFVVCGFVCMWLFEQKQRSALIGFLLGLLLGLIGIVIALLLPEKTQPNYTSFLEQTDEGLQLRKATSHRAAAATRRHSALTSVNTLRRAETLELPE